MLRTARRSPFGISRRSEYSWIPMRLLGTVRCRPGEPPCAVAAGAHEPAAAAAAPVPRAAPRNRLRLRLAIELLLPSEVDDGRTLTSAPSAQTPAEAGRQKTITSETPAVKPPSSPEAVTRSVAPDLPERWATLPIASIAGLIWP